jgi:hypothetical protein
MDVILPTMTDKWQIRPFVREGAPHGQNSNFQTRMNIWSWFPDGARNQDRLTDRQLQCDSDFHSENSENPANESYPVWRRGSNTSTVATVVLRVVEGDEKGSLETETVKCGHESIDTRTWEWLRWRGPAAIVNDRPSLSSKIMLHKDYSCKCSVGK